MKREKESVGSFLDVDTTEDRPCKFGTSSKDGVFQKAPQHLHNRWKKPLALSYQCKLDDTYLLWKIVHSFLRYGVPHPSLKLL